MIGLASKRHHAVKTKCNVNSYRWTTGAATRFPVPLITRARGLVCRPRRERGTATTVAGQLEVPATFKRMAMSATSRLGCPAASSDLSPWHSIATTHRKNTNGGILERGIDGWDAAQRHLFVEQGCVVGHSIRDGIKLARLQSVPPRKREAKGKTGICDLPLSPAGAK